MAMIATKSTCLLICARVLLLGLLAVTRGSAQPTTEQDYHTWAGHRIVTLEGFGDYFISDDKGRAKRIEPGGLGVNIVAVASKVEGDRIWIKANGAGDEPVGWVSKTDAVLLDSAIQYFTGKIRENGADWDAYLRRAESEHALNDRAAAIADYTRAISLRPEEPFLFLRRGRSYRTMQACAEAGQDFEHAASLRPEWAELYNQAAGVYLGCSDPAGRNPAKAMALIEKAIAMDLEHPTYLTVLASAYFQSGQTEKAVDAQRRALRSPRFPIGYREEAMNQLHQYEKAVDTKRTLPDGKISTTSRR